MDSANNRSGNIKYGDGTTLAMFRYHHNDQSFKFYAHNQTDVDFQISEDIITKNKANSGAEGGSLLLRNSSGGSGAFNRIYFAPTASSYTTRSCVIEGQNADGNNNMALIFKTSNGADPTEKYRIDSSGHTFKSLTGSGQAVDLRLHSTNTSGFGSTYAVKSTIRSVVDDSSNAHNSKLQFFVNNTSGNLTNAFTIQESSATFGGDVNLVDNKKLKLGTDQDTQIYHTGSHFFNDTTVGTSYIRNTGANSSGIIIRNDDAGDIHLDNDFAGNIKLSTNANTRMVLDSSGRTNFGGGTVNKGKLTVDGSVTVGSATEDPDISVTLASGSDDVAFTYDSGSIEANVHMTGTTTADCTVTFLYQATSWKSWFLEYKFSSTDGGISGNIGGYNNNSSGHDKTIILNGFTHSVSVSNVGQHVKVVFNFASGLGIHPFAHFKYWQGGHDGKPRADRLNIEYEES